MPHNITAAATASRRLIVTTILAFLISSSSRRLPNILLPWLLRRFAQTKISITAKVVVLMPPAVDPGLPPINISTIVTSLLLALIPPTSIVLKPAVLAVTEANKEVNTFSPTPISAIR